MLPVDLAGRPVDPLQTHGAKVNVLLFVRTDCPISNRYAPEIQRLYDKFSREGVVFWLVYLDPHESVEVIRKHIKEYGYRLRALRDPQHRLVKMTGVRVTPEAAVFIPKGSESQMVYRGRIDNRYVSFAQERPRPTTHDLESALEAIANGRPVPSPSTRAVGCLISDLR